MTVSIRSAISLAVLLTCTGIAADEKSSWRGNMKSLSDALAETVPLLYSSDPKDAKILIQKVEALNKIAGKLDSKPGQHKQFPESDPALPYIASMFSDSLERATVSLKEGRTTYGKSVLRSSIAYCTACHTRHEAGAQFSLLKAFEKPLEKADWIERVEFMAATRQYDELLKQVSAKLKAPSDPGTFAMDLERGTRLGLSVLVRIKKDPAQASRMARDFGQAPDAVLSMKEASQAWLKDLNDWAQSKERNIGAASALFDRGRRLGESLNTPHPEVRALVATVHLHDFIETKPEPSKNAEALYWLGRSYERLGDIGLWNLNEAYYRACVDALPHTEISEKCFAAYADSVTLGFSGSGGVRVPKSVREHLDRIRGKAMREQKVPISK